MNQFIVFCMLLLLFTSCDNATINSSRFRSLYRQRIAYSHYVVYDYVIDGNFVFDGQKMGLTILDSNAAISEDQIVRLPAFYFVGKPTLPTLKMLDIYSPSPITERDTSLKPQRQYATFFSGITIKTTEYKQTWPNGATGTGLMEFMFDGFEETKDSLIFYNTCKIFGDRDLSERTSFVKGNIKIVDSTDNKINYIEVNEPVIERRDVYNPISNQVMHDQAIVGVATFWFYPKTITLTSGFTDYGLYKRIK